MPYRSCCLLGRYYIVIVLYLQNNILGKCTVQNQQFMKNDRVQLWYDPVIALPAGYPHEKELKVSSM